MSKTSYVLIAVMITALLFMGAVRGYQFYASQAAQRQEQDETAGYAFSFQNTPLRLALPEAEPVSPPIPFSVPKQDIFLQDDTPLTQEAEIQQAQETLASILADYKDDPTMKAFNRELKEVTNGRATDIVALSGGDLAHVLRQNPQIGQVVAKYMQNQDFAKSVQEIFTNPQFIESVEQLRQAQAPARAKKAAK